LGGGGGEEEDDDLLLALKYGVTVMFIYMWFLKLYCFYA
jgi:hypothetical protein